MCLVKRIVPFAAALTLGLFVASFFVTVSAPRFNFRRNQENRYRKMQYLERDNQRMQEQIRRQQSRIEELETRRTADFENSLDETELPPAPSVSRRTR